MIEQTFTVSPRVVAGLLVRLLAAKLTPIAKAAKRHERALRRVFLHAVREAQEAVPMGELERALSIPGTGGPLYVLEDVITMMLEETPREIVLQPYFKRVAAGKKKTPAKTPTVTSVLSATMADGANATELCVVEPDRILRAKQHANPARKEWQDRGEANEVLIAKMVKGTALDDNEPMDVVVRIGGRKNGVEVKTFIDNRASKITMNKEALRNKARWKRQNKASVHTVIIDDRDLFNSSLYSGHKIYYRRGVGSFRIESMEKVQDAAHLVRLLRFK